MTEREIMLALAGSLTKLMDDSQFWAGMGRVAAGIVSQNMDLIKRGIKQLVKSIEIVYN